MITWRIDYDGHKYALLRTVADQTTMIGLYPTLEDAEHAYKQQPGSYGDLVHTTSYDRDARPTL